MSLLCIDVGNSHTAVGVFDRDRLTADWRVTTDVRRTADEWAVLLSGLLHGSAGLEDVDGICICSTVPVVLHELRSMAAEYLSSVHTVVVGPGVKTGLPVLMDNPREVGTDRIANAIAALDLVSGPCIIVDLGTATTFDVVNGNGEYVGGAIAPGVEISLAALGERGAQLRQVELERPRSVIAKNTIEALQSGAVFGFAGQIDGIVSRMAAELPTPRSGLTVIATGLVDSAVLTECTSITSSEPHLTLHGLRLIFERNPSPPVRSH